MLGPEKPLWVSVPRQTCLPSQPQQEIFLLGWGKKIFLCLWRKKIFLCLMVQLLWTISSLCSITSSMLPSIAHKVIHKIVGPTVSPLDGAWTTPQGRARFKTRGQPFVIRQSISSSCPGDREVAWHPVWRGELNAVSDQPRLLDGIRGTTCVYHSLKHLGH